MIMANHLFQPKAIIGVEINSQAVKHGRTNLKANGMDSSMIIHGSIQDYMDDQGFDVIVSNPPYFKMVEPIDSSIYQGRYDHTLPIDDLIQNIARLLKPKGHADIVYPVARINALIRAIYTYGLSISKMRYFHPKQDKSASVVALTIRHGLNQHCIVEKPWHDDDLITFEKMIETMDNSGYKEKNQ